MKPFRSLPVDRRAFLGGCGAMLATSLLPRAGVAGGTPVTITARPGQASLLEDGGPLADIWGYDGGVPGPALRMRQGETLSVLFRNDLPQPSTIHWHGIRIDNAYDGVAGLTQEAVPPGETFEYRITAPDAGTYWYHPHNRSWEQLARGLYGVLVVEEPGAKAYDREQVLVFDDWRLGEDGRIDEATFGNMHDWSHHGRLGNVLTVNAAPYFTAPGRPGERLRLRILNTANARVLSLRFAGLSPRVIALDGQPVEPHALNADTLVIAPAQRADLIVDIPLGGGRFPIEEVSLQPYAAAEIVAAGEAIVRIAPLPEDIGLPANPLPAHLAMNDALPVELLMQGGAMGSLREGKFHGRMMDIRELVQNGMAWTFNGTAGSHHDPALFSAPRGRTVHMPIVNDTNWQHAIHIHGHHFRVLSRDGKPEAAPVWRDTVLTEPGERVEIAFVADNPGKWMIHCHMLEHQAAGMGAWFEVA
ncbi:multicopper oxidase family protein [Stappia sp. F7233]|uniref:Multicopper oxidase family protein n=1 Tax=Stappia albiluteola TaxID=2758565 RepID=A0A839ACN1_9HYPH|nr:multicopper oxidase family protein [Stappia albiluteola]MBA5776627.1 multicopper oxidase family protein [Stappia albiluteola]